MSSGERRQDRGEPLERPAFLVALIGASAVGKSTLAERLQAAGAVEITRTVSTRPLRETERQQPPSDRTFVTPAGFDEQRDTFLAAKLLYGAWYAVPYVRKPAPGRVPLIVLKPCFIEEVKAYYPALKVYHIEARSALLPDRMRQRGQDEADITNRMWEHGAEVLESRHLADHAVDNSGELDDALRLLSTQISADHANYRGELAALPPQPGSDQPAMLQ